MSGDVEDDVKEEWNVRDLRRSSERGPSALDRVKSLCELLLLPVSTTVVEVEQQIEDAIWTFADSP